MIMLTSSVIILDVDYTTKHQVNTLPEYGALSIDPANKMPYHEYNDIINPKKRYTGFNLGDLVNIEYDTNGSTRGTLKSIYREHSFEIAVVLEGNYANELLVYGNKIGIHLIDKNQTSLPGAFIEATPGSELLLDVSKRISIVHNITMAKRNYDRMMNMKLHGPNVK